MNRLALLSLFLVRTADARSSEGTGRAGARVEEPVVSGPQKLEPGPRFRDFHRVLAHNFTRGLFSLDNLKPLALGSIGTAAFLPFDHDISDAYLGDFHQLGDTGHFIGSPAAIAALTSGLLAATPFTENQRYRGFTFTFAQGVTCRTC